MDKVSSNTIFFANRCFRHYEVMLIIREARASKFINIIIEVSAWCCVNEQYVLPPFVECSNHVSNFYYFP